MAIEIRAGFRALTEQGEAGVDPFPWQQRLYVSFVRGDIPRALDIPTGLGKTKVMAIWLLALAAGAAVPRRLVYVVDRRAVVDQASGEARLIAEGCMAAPFRDRPSLVGGLAVSTLRGQHIDSGAWLENPARPAIIVGTVDMIGSRLLFEGYGVSRRMRPIHAGLLGVDTLVVLDEAHLVPPFEALMAAAASDVTLGGREALPRPRLRLMALSATQRQADDGSDMFRLDQRDTEDPEIARRIGAVKRASAMKRHMRSSASAGSVFATVSRMARR